MAENYFVESRKHIKVILTIMESMLRNGKATREEDRDIFRHWHKWLLVIWAVWEFLVSIIGMSLLNSIFVDAMVSDDDEGIKNQLNSIESSLDEIKKKIYTER